MRLAQTERLRRTATLLLAVVTPMAVYAYAAPPGRRMSHSARSAENVVAVLPFRLTSPAPGLADLGHAMQDLLASRLISEESGGQRLTGEIGGTPERLTIEARLAPVTGVTKGVHARVEGSADSLPYLADRLVVRLLAAQAARDSAELVALGETSLPALRAYLAGRHAARRGKVGAQSEAKAHFDRALFLDSTFALAGLRLAEIVTRFGMAERDERWRLDAIWRDRDRLGPADRALLEAYMGPHHPRPATLRELIDAADRATRVAPHRAEAWHVAGVNFFRFGPRIGYPDWQAQATEAFRRALSLDSTEVFPLQYLLLLAALEGDRDAVRRYAELHRALNPVGGHQTDFIQWVAAMVLRDSASAVRLRGRLPEMTGESLQLIVDWSANLGIGLGDGDLAAREYERRFARSANGRRSVTMRLVPFSLNRGRPNEASRLLSASERGFGQAADVGALEFRIYAALYWDGDSSDAAAAARSLEAYLDGISVGFGQVRDRATAACAIAHWRLATDNLRGAETALRQARRFATAADAASISSTPICIAAAEAQLAAALHAPNADAALERLDGLLAAGSEVQHVFPSVAAVIAARLYEKRGDLPHALALARHRAFWYSWLVSTPLREQGRLAALVGDTASAIRAYRHYLELRSEPEPALQSDVKRVRADLARLESPPTPSP